jgi:arylsulfatase A-like enzyme
MSRALLPLRRAALALILGAAGAACGSPDHGLATVWRLIEDDPEILFQRSRLVTSASAVTWRFQAPDDVAAWELSVPPSEARLAADGLVLSPQRQYVSLARPVDLLAEDIDAIELQLRGVRRQPVTLEWAGPGEGFARERSIVLEEGGRDVGGGEVRHRISTHGHPLWRGRVERLRFGLSLPRSRRCTVVSIAAVDERAPESQLGEVLARPWKVEIANDVRNAVLALPGAPIRRELEVPEAAELHLSYALQPRAQGPVRFEVAAVLPDGTRRQLMAESMAEGAAGWREARLDLSELAGVRAGLELVTTVEGPFDPVRGFPVWGNPEVVAPARLTMPNIVLVCLDTLRADHLSLYGYGRPTSPHLDAWARGRAAVFETVVAPAPWTLPAHASMFSGLDAHRHGVNLTRPAPASLTMLAEVLRAAGYATLAVTGGGFVHPQYGFAQGFDRYWSFAVKVGAEGEIEAEVDRACAALEANARRPFFLFLHTYEVHNPFLPRQPYFGAFSEHPDEEVMVDVERLPASAADGFLDHRGLVVRRAGGELEPLPDSDLDLAVDLYDSGIANADAHLAAVLRRIEHLGIDRRTVVVITSDHGELFGEHGVFNHVSLYEENLLVPLVIADPRRAQPRRIGDQVRLIDLAPTILELAGAPPLPAADGASLVPLLDARPGARPPGLAWSFAAASNYGISARDANRTKYTARMVPWPITGPAERLYDLAADPREQQGDPAGRPDLERFRRLTSEELARDLAGVRVRIACPENGARCSGSLEGDELSAQNLKSIIPGQAAMTFGPRREAHFTLEPGERVEVALLDAGRALTLRLDPFRPGGPPLVTTVDLSSLSAVVQATPAGDRWLVASGDRPAPVGLSLWRHGSDRPEEVEIDATVLDQLEALGYAP